jgi:endoglucanase
MFLKTTPLRVMLCWALSGTCVQADTPPAWSEWDDFAGHFVQADGRVVDLTFERKSTSEGQSYALFFALVANRRSQFDKILAWTSDNLAAGQLGEKLPGWHWGLREDGSWGMKDPNSASDADLWIAYALLEAARLWKAPQYATTARQLLTQIRKQEIVQAGQAGPVLLPAVYGFQLDRGRWRIDPSYLPGFMFRYFAEVDPQGPWQAIWDGYMRMAPLIFSKGVAPDLFVVDAVGVVMPDTEREPSGSYDAIRVYLWAGMWAQGSQPLLDRLKPYAELIRKLGVPPEKVNPVTGAAIPAQYAPIGYSGAVLPFLHALGEQKSLARQLERVNMQAANARRGQPGNYYDQVLILFGKGWLDGKYRFDAQGRLQPKW